jgi:hypothetical protein
MHKIYDSHCVETPDETRRSLVIIDGGRFEFYIPTSEENSMTSSFMFDTHIMGPLMSKWLMPKLTYLKTPTDFKDQLLKYIARCYDQSYQIHAISFILDYPKSSAVRQWSHIDGYKNMYQGSISCGNGSSVTLEFCCLDPKVTTPSDLQHVWKFLPKTNGVISAIHGNSFCTHLLKEYSSLLNHAADAPLNPVSFQKSITTKHLSAKKKSDETPVAAGTVFRMPGNTIHAGPESDKRYLRAIFLCCQST